MMKLPATYADRFPLRLPDDCKPPSGVRGIFATDGSDTPPTGGVAPEPARRKMGIFVPKSPSSTFDPAMYDPKLRRPQQERRLDRQDAAFVRWARKNHPILFEFCELALRAKDRRVKVGAKGLVEFIRWRVLLDIDFEPDGKGYALSNSHTSRIARVAVAVCPELERFFEMNKLQERIGFSLADCGIFKADWRRELGLTESGR